MTRLTRGTALAAVTLSSCLIAACGSSSDQTSTTAAKDAHRIEVELTDTGCTPANATVPAGPVTIAAANNGTAKTDEIELKSADGTVLGERENLAPGLSGDLTLTLQPGRYELLCTFQNEDRHGGTLTVTGAAVERR